MATLGIAQQQAPSLPIGFLRKAEQLRRDNPQLLALIEKMNGFAFPSEVRKATSPPTAVRSAGVAGAQSIPVVRSGNAFASLASGEEVSEQPKSTKPLPKPSKPAWDMPLARVRIVGSPVGLRPREKQQATLVGGGGSQAEDEEPVGLRITEDELARVTEDDVFRIIEDA